MFNKICLLGDFAAGKTSLNRRFVERRFSHQYLSTVGARISHKTVVLESNAQQAICNVPLIIWDLEGRTKFKDISPMYLQGASGGIIVADATRRETITRIREYIDLFTAINSQAAVIIALNKVDLISPQTLDDLLPLVSFESDSRVLATYQTSAKTGENVDAVFRALASHLRGRLNNQKQLVPLYGQQNKMIQQHYVSRQLNLQPASAGAFNFSPSRSESLQCGRS
ncbi:MAG: GTP-binding protein [Cyanothece sp. SIO1E1]|nr:GTP-binding protein [Cyanothece sp. SIO1E1]